MARREKRKASSILFGKKRDSWKRGYENKQTDPLDGGTQVEDKLGQKHALSSSDPQTEGLSKGCREPIDSNLDRRGAGWSRIACEPLLPGHAPMGALCPRER